MRIFTLVFGLVMCSFIRAQVFEVKGRVSSQGHAVSFAAVELLPSGKGVLANEKGEFLFQNVNAGKYRLRISAVGFQRKETQAFTLTRSEVMNIELEPATSIKEVVITGTMKEVSKLESPVPIDVYHASFFKSNPVPNLFECMQNINGIRAQVNCNVCTSGDIHINGLEGPYTMILIDGMPMMSGLSSVYGLMGIPQDLIERIEVVKGPSSTLYGSEAMAGIINVITKNASDAPRFTANTLLTSWGEVSTDAGWTTKWGKNTRSLTGINYFNFMNPIDNNGDGITDMALQNRISLFHKFNFGTPSSTKKSSVAMRYTYEDRWGGQLNWTPAFRGGDSIYGESIYINRFELFGIHDLPIKGEDVKLWYSFTSHHQNSVYGTTLYNGIQSTAFVQGVWNKTIGKHDLTGGLTYRFTFYDDNSVVTQRTNADSSIANEAVLLHQPGIFLQNEYKINSKSRLLAGVRYDYNFVHGHVASPRLNFKTRIERTNTTVRLGGGSGYRIANVFTEDHAALTGARQVVFTEQLKPETSWNGTLNVSQPFNQRRKLKGTADISLFHTFFTNRIFADFLSNPNQIIYKNIEGSGVSQGLNANLELDYDSKLKVYAGVTLMDVFVKENNERIRPILTEQVSATWNISYTLPGERFSLHYTGNLIGPMVLPVLGPLDNRPELSPWFSLQNVQLIYNQNKRIQWMAGVKNLLNYTPPANSIARAFDPFDKQVAFDANGQALPTPTNPNALTFDPSYVFAPNQGIRFFLGFKFTLL